MKELFKTHKNNLLLIAGIVWGFAGFNILRIGVMAYAGYASFVNILLSGVIFVAFQIMVFGKMVRKHTTRITQYEEDRQFLFKFFDVKGFCIMAFMITFGVGLRVSGICPDVFIAVFYTGLGTALMCAGILFIVNYIKECRASKKSCGMDEIN